MNTALSGMTADPQPHDSDTRLIRRNFAWTMAANFVYTGCQWGMLVVLARLGNPAMVGRFTLGLAITAPVFMFASLQLRSVQATDAHGEYRFGDYLGLQLVMSALGMAAVALICAIAGYRLGVALAILAVGLAKAIESLSEVFFGLMQRHERMDWISKAVILKGPLALIAMGIAVKLTSSVFYGALGLAGAWMLCLLAYEARFAVRLLRREPANAVPGSAARVWRAALLRPHWNRPVLVKLAWLALPLGLVLMLSSLNTNVPRYFIERLFGERELGIFSAMAYVTLGLHTVARSLGQSGIAAMSRQYALGNARGFRRLLTILAGGGLLIGALGFLAAELAGRQMLTLLYGPEYAGESRVFVWLMLGAGISFVAYSLQQALTAARCLRAQAWLFGAATAVTALTCFWLIPTQGLMGAAVASIVSAALQAAGSVYILARALHALGRRPGAAVGVPAGVLEENA